jgi:hypothetical protein
MASASPNGFRPIPDFVIPGFSKCGTTTLFEWLARCSEVSRGGAKEPGFFAYDDLWERGWEWYASVVGDPGAGFVGDGSPAYLDPNWSEAASTRLAAHRPDVRIFILYRDPVERAISHFRHEVRRGREKTPVDRAPSALTMESPYIRASRYATGLAPWVERFPSDQMLVIPLARLSDLGWEAALDHIGLDRRPPPDEVYNDSTQKRSYTAVMRTLYDRNIIQRIEKLAPRGLRKLGARVLLRDPVDKAAPAAEVRDSLSPDVVALLDDEWDRFQQMIRTLPAVPAAS